MELTRNRFEIFSCLDYFVGSFKILSYRTKCGWKKYCKGATNKLACTEAVFSLSQFFSANQRFVGTRANSFWQHGNHSFRKFDKFVDIWHLVYFTYKLIQNLGHINIFLQYCTQLFQENLCTCRLAQKLEGTRHKSMCVLGKLYQWTINVSKNN